MHWITRLLKLSVGKKPIMALSGFVFCTFLAAHLIGNLTIYCGKDSFNKYAEHLHTLGPLITIFELGLLLFGLLHIILAIVLFFENKKARPIGYAVNKKVKEQTIGSSTSHYTGIILLIFIFVHLINFHFTDKTTSSIFSILNNIFSNPYYVCFYVASIIAAAIHVSHGFWSAFQTIGINHAKYTSIIKLTGSVFSLIIAIGFGFIPIYVMLFA